MKKLLTIFLLFLNCLFFNTTLSPSFAYQQLHSEETKYIKGTISYVDFVGSTVTVKFAQSDGDNDEITLAVTLDTNINKGGLYLSISDLSDGDEVVVQYHAVPMSFGPLEADQISVKPTR